MNSRRNQNIILKKESILNTALVSEQYFHSKNVNTIDLSTNCEVSIIKSGG